MSTRSHIGYETETGEIRAIYCHYDGYPRGVLHSLMKHYRFAKQVKELVDGGTIRCVEEIGKIERWDSEVLTFANREEWLASLAKENLCIEFVYLFEEFDDYHEREFYKDFCQKDGDWYYYPNPNLSSPFICGACVYDDSDLFEESPQKA